MNLKFIASVKRKYKYKYKHFRPQKWNINLYAYYAYIILCNVILLNVQNMSLRANNLY